MLEEPFVPQHRFPNDEEAARIREWSEKERRRDRWKAWAVLCVLVAFVAVSFLAPRPSAPPSRDDIHKTPEELLSDIRASRDQTSAAIQRLRISVASKQQLDELVTLQTKVERLKVKVEELSVLSAGQESLARTYRTILSERSLWNRVSDFILGVLASLIAALVWDRPWRRWARKRVANPPGPTDSQE